MIRASLSTAAALLLSCAAFAQTAATPPGFEVVSIKPAPPPTGGRMMIGMGGDPGRLVYNNVSLRDLIRQAYQVKECQVSGPDWIGSTRFDVTAKIPEGAPREQVPQMLQALLAEPFKLAIHREKKELPSFALVVGKNGPKMKESSNEDTPVTFKLPDGAPPPPPPGMAQGFGGGRGGSGMIPPKGGAMMMMGPGRLQAKRMALPNFCEMLSAKLDYRQGYYAGKQFSKFTSADKERQLQDALMLGDPITELTIQMEVNYFQLNSAEYFVP